MKINKIVTKLRKEDPCYVLIVTGLGILSNVKGKSLGQQHSGVHFENECSNWRKVLTNVILLKLHAK